MRAEKKPQKEKNYETLYNFDVRNRPGRRSVPCGPDPQHQRAGFAQHADGEKAQKACQEERGRSGKFDCECARQKVVWLVTRWEALGFGELPIFFDPTT
jgi:hypothetical protein